MWTAFLIFVLIQLVHGDCSCPKGFENIPEKGVCIGSPEIYGHGWDVNERTCATYGGMLVTIHDVFYNTLLGGLAYHAFAENQVMIGVRRHIGAEDPNWYWPDGSPLDYTIWAPGHPADTADCAFIDGTDNQWRGGTCGQTNPYLCQLSSSPSSLHFFYPYCSYLDRCREGFAFNSNFNKCYYLGHDKSYVDAESTCIRYDGHLASVHSAAENQYLRNLARDDSCVGEFPLVAGSTLIGGVYAGDNVLQYWADGSPVNYTNFCDHNSNMAQSTVMLRAMPTDCDFGCGSGQWMAGIDTIYTSRTYPSFICEADPLC